MKSSSICRCLILCLVVALGWAQQRPVPVPPGFGPRTQSQAKPKPAPAKPKPQTAKPKPAEGQAGQAQTEFVGPQPEGAPPATEAAKPAAQQQAATTTTTSPTTGALNLQNASLIQVIDALCRQLKINYILDPRVQGSVTLNTYGEIRDVDTRSLLDLILRINGAAIVQVGEIYRIVPLVDASRMPIPPEQMKAPDIPEDDQIMLNLIFLKYVTVEELSALLEPFIGEGASTWAYSPANLLLILDSRRNMRRTMELVGLFDSDTLASQRVRLFDVEHGRPSDIATELETVLQSIALGESGSPIKFLPIDRLNIVIAVAPNPGAFEAVEEWIKKLDQPVKATAGATENFVYRVRYGRAENLAGAIMQLYFGMSYGFPMGGYGLFSGAASSLGNRYGNRGFGMGFGGGYGGFGGGYGGGYGGYGGGYGGYGGGYGGYGGYGGGYGGYGGGYGSYPSSTSTFGARPTTEGGEQLPSTFSTPEGQTGSYLRGGGYGGGWPPGVPRIVPNPMNNTLLIQATQAEYRQILKLLDDMDLPPRQVLIDAKIYEVTLTGALAFGVQAFLQERSNQITQGVTGQIVSPAINLSIGSVVSASRELLLEIQASELSTKSKVISAPSVIATDSLPATITIGAEVPTLTAQAVSPIQSGGNSLFTNTVANRDTGVTLGILAQVSPSGIVTMVIDQEVSTPIPPTPGEIQSPSFSKRTVQTQVTVNDGDTIAIGGIISDTQTQSSGGVPVLHRIPVLGAAFGAKSRDRDRTELVVFLTPRVIYDTNQIIDATEELKSRFRRITRLMNDD